MGDNTQEEIDIEDTFIGLYKAIVDNKGMSLKDIDDINLETLFDYLFWKDPNERIINGKVYKRSNNVPNWL